MKKIILFVVFAGLLTTSYAQKQSYAEKRAKEATTFATSEVNLNQKDSDFLYSVLVEKMTSTSEQINGKDVSKEEKKAIYSASHKATSKKLAAHFSKDTVEEIFAALKQYTANSKKK